LKEERGSVTYPVHYDDLARTPEWAMPIVEAALSLAGR